MKNQKARIGDYIPEDDVMCKIIDITENNDDVLYHLDSGSIICNDDFSVDDIRLESEVIG